jgi:hypothetical protein
MNRKEYRKKIKEKREKLGLCFYCGKKLIDEEKNSCNKCKEKKRIKKQENKEHISKMEKERYQRNKEKIKERIRLYRLKNPEKIKEMSKNYYSNNSDKVKEYQKEYREKFPDKKKNLDKKYYLNNQDKITKNNKKYYNNNKENISIKEKEYKSKNRDRISKRDREYYRKNKNKLISNSIKYVKLRRKKDPNFNICLKIRVRVFHAFINYTKTGKIYHSKEYGIDYKAIIEHLKPFPEDISKYHIDHIRPLCSFNFINSDGSTNLEEVKKAFAPENHQWLLAEENLRKAGEDRKLSIHKKQLNNTIDSK